MNDDMKEAVDALVEPSDPSIFVASNGLRLKLKRVSDMIVVDAGRRLKAPQVPRVFDEEKQRELENPADPAYQRAVREYQMEAGILAMNAYFILGTKIIEPLPEDIEPVDSPGWEEMLRAIDPNVDVPPAGPRRYLAWLKYHALPGGDQVDLLNSCQIFSGSVSEEDARAALANFRANEARNRAARLRNSSQARFGAGDGVEPDRNGAATGDAGSGSVLPPAVEPMAGDPVF